MLSLTPRFPCVSCFPSSHSTSIMWLLKRYIFVTIVQMQYKMCTLYLGGIQKKLGKEIMTLYIHYFFYDISKNAFLCSTKVEVSSDLRSGNGFKLFITNIWILKVRFFINVNRYSKSSRYADSIYADSLYASWDLFIWEIQNPHILRTHS